jgi:dihydroneopterin aldolase
VWNPQANHQCVALRDVRVAVRVGVHAAERTAPQLLIVDVELYRLQQRFAGTSLADCLDYDRVYFHLAEEWPKRPHVDLLETLAEGLAQFCLTDARIDACRVVIRKPEIYPGTATPELAVYRLRLA